MEEEVGFSLFPSSLAQNAIAGEGMGISHELISLDISSPHVPDLTLIDLPGITRVPVGNQPADIGYQIKTLIRKYIFRQETINLVVVPSNVDIATTEALSMAQEVDPDGDRTIGILTKPDLVDKGTEDKVVDVVRNLGLENVLSSEYEEKVRPCIDLIDSLRALGVEQDMALPAIAVIGDQSSGKSSVLEALSGVALPRGSVRLETTVKLTGRPVLSATLMRMPLFPTKLILTGSNQAFGRAVFLLAALGRLPLVGYETICRQIWKFENQYRGRELPGFVNYKTFENIIKQQVKILEEPAVDMLHIVTDIVRLAFSDVSEKNYKEFINLHRTSKSKIEDIKLEQEREAEKFIRLHFKMEQIIYCQDHVYRSTLKKIREEEAEEDKKNKPSRSSVQHNSPNDSIAEILQHLMAYRQEASNRLSSHIPLIIQYFILQSYGQQLRNSMLQLLQDKEKYSWLLKERSDTSDKRRFLKERHARLTQARHRLAKFPG
ncbi:PREDICTED: interferon-induced GTP-binding protein Mx1-like [Hipposideros armiger]|uniref:Interferon-induced GTP-binding protein Mx1 n=1 Tax=Hipposideros armiger TaxID=186990 RepID=A0A8B7PYM9_HIPAR|nr:PREDICTED: interferon-induced GTP-binding protein Mx1-like [Hipposideros armiger]